MTTVLEAAYEPLPCAILAADDAGIVRWRNAAARRLPALQVLSTCPPRLALEGGGRIALQALASTDAWRWYVVADDAAPPLALTATALRRALAHELRSPLATTLALVEALRDGSLPLGDEALQRIGEQTWRALGRADTSLRILRAAAFDPCQGETLDLQRVLHEAADECWERARKAACTLEVLDEGEGALSHGDLELLRSALIALIDNAIEHGPAAGRVRVSLRGIPNGWALAVEDQGPGIPPPIQAALQIPPGPGGARLGLGLLLASLVLRQHGAGLRIGEGGCVAMELERCDENTAAPPI